MVLFALELLYCALTNHAIGDAAVEKKNVVGERYHNEDRMVAPVVDNALEG